MTTLAKNIRKYRKQKGFSQDYVADRLGYKSYTTIQKWESGDSEPSLSVLHKLAKILEVDINEFVNPNNDEDNTTSKKGIRIPVLGYVPAGIPIEAIEDEIDWEEIPESWTTDGSRYFGLRVQGDSMYPKYLDGDTVIVRIQSYCDSGQDCVVYTNGFDATLKNVKIRDDGSMSLIPYNTSYSPKTYSLKEIKDLPVVICGVIKELRRTIN